MTGAVRPIALVTGAGRGIGLATSRALAELDFTVLVTARQLTKAQAAVQAAPAASRMIAHALDVTEDGQVARLAEHVATRHGRLDVLINNAATNFDFAPTASKVGLAFARATLETNLFGAWRMVKAFLPLLERSDSPRIVNVSSAAGTYHDPGGVPTPGGSSVSYALSKLALNGLTAKLAVELAPSGVLVNAVCPGIVADDPSALADAVASVVWAATLPRGGPSGRLLHKGEALPW
jgi:NAD(P)-dependent dehydrogenase (short-subunit alcohol dehydrogenase family)